MEANFRLIEYFGRVSERPDVLRQIQPYTSLSVEKLLHCGRISKEVRLVEPAGVEDIVSLDRLLRELLSPSSRAELDGDLRRSRSKGCRSGKESAYAMLSRQLKEEQRVNQLLSNKLISLLAQLGSGCGEIPTMTNGSVQSDRRNCHRRRCTHQEPEARLK